MPTRARGSGPARQVQGRTVRIKLGHISGSPTEYTVDANLTVAQLIAQLNFELQDGDKVVGIDTKTVDLTETVQAGKEYIVASNLKARNC